MVVKLIRNLLCYKNTTKTTKLMAYEDFCDFEQSSILKELGFNKEVNHYYLGDDSLHEVSTFQDFNDDSIQLGENIEHISAPSLSQVVEWLKEKGIELTIEEVVYPCEDPYYYHLEHGNSSTLSMNFETSDAALFAGIDEALEELLKEQDIATAETQHRGCYYEIMRH